MILDRSPKPSTALQSRSDSTVPFFLADSSPIFVYGLSSSSASHSASSPWTAGYALQNNGYDETLHLTTTSNSTVSFNVSATTLTLLIPPFTSCQSTISINGSSPQTACSTGNDTNSSTSGTPSTPATPFTVYNLPEGIHQVTYNTGPLSSTSQLVFWGIDGTRVLDPDGFANVTIDDGYQRTDGPVHLNYSGAWTHLTPVSSSDGLSEAKTLSQEFNQTLSVSQRQGASVTFSGAGSAIYVYGTVGPDYGSASITHNGVSVAPYLNLTSPWALPYELLWFRTGLDTSVTQNVTFTNLENQKMSFDFVVLTAGSDTLSALSSVSSNQSFISTTAGKLVFFLLIPLLVILLLIGASLLFCTRRRRSRRQAANLNNRLSTVNLSRPYSGSGGKSEPTRESYVSGESDDSFREVVVTYAEAKGQQLSGRSRGTNSDAGWRSTSPTSPETQEPSIGHGIGRLPPGFRASDLPYMGGPGNISLGTHTRGASPSTTSPGTESTQSPDGERRHRWSGVGQSMLLGQSLPSPSALNRQTALPAYTPGDNGTFDDASEGSGTARPGGSGSGSGSGGSTTGESNWMTAQEEKARLAGGTSTHVTADSNKHSESNAEEIRFRDTLFSRGTPSSIMSVLGAPPSERARDSAFASISGSSRLMPSFISGTAFSPYAGRTSEVPYLPAIPKTNQAIGMISSNRPSPRVDTSTSSQPVVSDSPGSSQIANSAHPLLYKSAGTNGGETDDEQDWKQFHQYPFFSGNSPVSSTRGRHKTIRSVSAKSDMSAARPDSEVIPF